MAISIRQIEYLIALAREGSFSRAAEALNVSQPAFSVQIKNLEEDLGVLLVERQPRGVVVTPVGHEIVAHAQTIADELEALRQTARWGQGLSGRLTLGLIPTVAPYLLPGALPLLRAGDLRLDVRIREAQTLPLLTALRRGQIDAAVIALPFETEGLAVTPLFEDRFLLIGTRRRLAEAASTTPRDLDPNQLLLLEEGHCLSDHAMAACSFPKQAARLDLGASSLSTLCGLVAEGMGLTLLPELAVSAEARRAGDLALRRFAAPEPGRTIALLRRTRSPDDGWVGTLAQALRTAAEGPLSYARRAWPPPASHAPLDIRSDMA